MDIGALSVRGNHDHEVVRQASKYREKLKAMGGIDPFLTSDDQSNLPQSNLPQFNLGSGHGKTRLQQHLELALQFTPAELAWLAELPYFIRSVDLGSVFVHAGFKVDK